MKKLLAKGIFGYIAAVFIIVGISWAATCGIIKLITLCFGIDFSWGIATGIWLILCLLSMTFNKSSKK